MQFRVREDFLSEVLLLEQQRDSLSPRKKKSGLAFHFASI
jgi:hypothetical protein